ncbi:MAG: membrane-bound lytic murein transglycosylase MltF [Rhodocyclaceae bacterium]|nr:membrane-bound lytic murein transglycosylase MltF [Rhodocyclaceae bacterium]
MHGIHKPVGLGAVAAALVGVALLLLACRPHEPALPPPQHSGELVVVSRQSPTTVYRDADGQLAGPDFDLVSAFANSLGVKVRWVWVERERQMHEQLDRGRAHMAAAALSPSAPALALVRFGPPFLWRHQAVAMRSRDGPMPYRVSQLAGLNGWVAADTHAARVLEDLAPQPGGALQHGDPATAVDALHRVADGQLDYAVVDSLLLARMRHWLIDLEQAFEIPGPRPVAWAFPRYGNEQFYEAAADFLARSRANGALAALHERHFGHLRRLDTFDIGQLLEHRESRLPRYRELFREAARVTGIDWRWLAALAYQESKWDPLATSWTNVRGMMMLTETTAQQMGVTNRLDARQSILAGARYLARIMEALPPKVSGEDRLMMALAAYNLGEGHLRAGRRMAAAMKLDADTWGGVKRALPELARPDIAARLVSGPARGGEAVILVENVRGYYEVLAAAERDGPTRQATRGLFGGDVFRPPPRPADPIIW